MSEKFHTFQRADSTWIRCKCGKGESFLVLHTTLPGRVTRKVTCLECGATEEIEIPRAGGGE